MENRYWVVGTSTEKYLNNFLEMLKKGILTGEHFYIDDFDKSDINFVSNEQVVFKTTSYTTARQIKDIWEALGFITTSNKGYKILIDIVDKELLIEFSKLFLFRKTNNKASNKFQDTLMINLLFYTGWISMMDIKNKGINQSRGQLNKEKINKSISNYEKELSKDKKILIKAMKEFKNE